MVRLEGFEPPAFWFVAEKGQCGIESNQSLAALANPQSRHVKAQFGHSQSDHDTKQCDVAVFWQSHEPEVATVRRATNGINPTCDDRVGHARSIQRRNENGAHDKRRQKNTLTGGRDRPRPSPQR